MELILNFLKRASPFSTLDSQHLHQLASKIEFLKVKAGDEIIRQGQEGETCYLIKTGKVQVVQKEKGREKKLAQLGSGAVFGEAALLTKAPRNATVKALEDTELLMLHRKDLLEALGSDKALVHKMYELLSLRDRPKRFSNITMEQMSTEDGSSIMVLKKPEGSYYRLSPEGWFVWQRLNGKHNLRDLSLAYFEAFKTFAPYVVAEIISGLAASGFVESQAVKANLPALGPKPCLGRRLLQKVSRFLNARIVFRNIDPSLTRIYQGGIRFLFTKPIQIIIFFVSLAGLLAFFTLWQKIVSLLPELLSAQTWILLIPSLLLSIVLHEAGHAFTTKAFGREVLSVGLGWYWLGPMVFVDTSDMWLANRWQRIMVSLAGIYVHIFLGGFASLIFFFHSSSSIAPFCGLFALASYVIALFNLNPLMAFDGYYALCDLLNRPNLKSFATFFHKHR